MLLISPHGALYIHRHCLDIWMNPLALHTLYLCLALSSCQNHRLIRVFRMPGIYMLEETVNILPRTLGQCLNATNSSGKNAYRTFLKYPQVSFQFGLHTRSSLIITLENVCIQSHVIVVCEKMHMVFRDEGGIWWRVTVKRILHETQYHMHIISTPSLDNSLLSPWTHATGRLYKRAIKP